MNGPISVVHGRPQCGARVRRPTGFKGARRRRPDGTPMAPEGITRPDSRTQRVHLPSRGGSIGEKVKGD
jgi:hypothetical protein